MSERLLVEHHLRRPELEIDRLTSVADSLRTELEALRAENAELKRLGEQQFDAGVQYSGIIAKLRAEVSRLTKERDEALSQEGYGRMWREAQAAQVRVQKLERLGDAMAEICANNDLSEYGGQQEINDWVEFREGRAALESGTGPIDPIGPMEKPIAPAPKTFTVEEIERALGVGTECLAPIARDVCKGEFRRALGIGEP